MSRLKDVWYSITGKSNTQSEGKEESVQAEKIGNVSLNAGDHGTIFGFNRNIIIGTGIAIFTITAIATIFAVDVDESDSSKRVPDRQQQASSAQDRRSETGKIKGDSYEDLAKSEANFLGRGNNNQVGRGNGTPSVQHQQDRTAPQAPSTALPTTPQTGSPPVSVPFLPTAPAAPTLVLSEEDKEQQEYMQRMKSSISFAFTDGAIQQRNDQQTQSSNAGDGAVSDNQNNQPGSSHGTTVSYSDVSYTAPGKYMLQAGTIIPVVLCTGINSDIGGQVVVQVQQNMYDTATGQNLLIPAGSKILGTYGKGSPNNSGRVEISFSTIVLPDGGSYSINGALVAIDGAGYSGLSGKVDRHTGSILSAGMFSSALAALGSAAAGNVSGTASTYSAGQLAMQGAMANIMNTASSLFQQGANKQMTVTAEPGTMFSVYVTQGIAFQRNGGVR